MKRMALATVLLVCASALAAADDKPKGAEGAAKKALEASQGKWLPTLREHDGKAESKATLATITLTIEGDRWTLVMGQGKAQRTVQGKSKFDPAKGTIDISFDGGGTALGIYELKDNELKFCYSLEPTGGPRPTKFSGAKGTKASFQVFKRAKP